MREEEFSKSRVFALEVGVTLSFEVGWKKRRGGRGSIRRIMMGFGM